MLAITKNSEGENLVCVLKLRMNVLCKYYLIIFQLHLNEIVHPQH